MTERRPWLRWGVVLGVVFVAGLIWWVMAPHKPIAMWNVAKVEIRPKDDRNVHPLSGSEAEQVIRWFNKASGIRNNPYHGAPGCGSYSTVMVYLKSGKVVNVESYMRVTIGKPGSRLEDLSADYYFEQPDLERYLRDWDTKADAGGC